MRQNNQSHHRSALLNNALCMGAGVLTRSSVIRNQGESLLNNWSHIVLIMIPLTIQIFLILLIAYLAAKRMKLIFDITASAL